MSLLIRDGDSTASECEDEDDAVKKLNRGKNVDWKNIAIFNNQRDAKDYMSEANLASRGYRRGNTVNNKNGVIWKSESTTTSYRERIVITPTVMLQFSGDDDEFQDVEKKRISDEARLIIDQYRENGISGGKHVLHLWSVV